MNNQIKSKDRVKDLGEVYTNEREVNAMLDLIGEDISNIESTILEPACGTGNFLVTILSRRLETIKNIKDTTVDKNEIRFAVFKAISTLYGIDICPDNVAETRRRLKEEIKEFWYLFLQKKYNGYSNFAKSINYVLEKNIIQGNTIASEKERTDIQIYEFKKTSYNPTGGIKKYYIDVEIFNYFDLVDDNVLMDFEESRKHENIKYDLVWKLREKIKERNDG